MAERTGDRAPPGTGRSAGTTSKLIRMAKRRKEKAQPKEGKPVDAGAPKRSVVMDALKRAALRRTSTSR